MPPPTQPSRGPCGLIPRLGKTAMDICEVTKGEEEPKKKTAFTHENAWKCFSDTLFFSGVIFKAKRAWGPRLQEVTQVARAEMQLLPLRSGCVCLDVCFVCVCMHVCE